MSPQDQSSSAFFKTEKPQDKPAPFDFEAFISGTQLARRTVSLYRVDHRDEVRRLTGQYEQAKEAVQDERVGVKSPRRDMQERIEALVAEMEASKTDFLLRTLTPDEFQRLRKDDNLDVFDQLEIQSIEPHLTADQWRQVSEAVGVAQWSPFVAEANDLILSKVVVPDFSRADSTTPRTGQSSRS